MKKIKVNSKYSVYTQRGFKSFDGISCAISSDLYEIKTVTDSIKATGDHKFKTADNNWVSVKCLKTGDILKYVGEIISIDKCKGESHVYDLLNVRDTHSFIANGFVSHNCDFLGSAQTLINANILLGMQAGKVKKSQYDILYYEEPVPGHEYVLVADVSKGRGQDYSTYSVIDVSTQPFRQVCTYRNNTISPLLFPDMIIRAAQIYNNALVIIENNDAGMVVCNSIYYDHEYENTFTTSSVKSNGIGVTMTKKVKRIGCSNLKDLIEGGKLHVIDPETIIELSSFAPKGDSFAGSDGTHDDCVMNLVLFAWFVSTDVFKSISNVDLKELLYKERLMEIEEDMLPFGFIENTESSHSHYDNIVDDIRRWKDL
jgi:hypothetical protein